LKIFAVEDAEALADIAEARCTRAGIFSSEMPTPLSAISICKRPFCWWYAGGSRFHFARETIASGCFNHGLQQHL